MTFVDEDGVIPDNEDVRPDNRTPLQIAQSELAGFKFRLIETVTGDLRLGKAPCTEAIVVFCQFLTIDKRTLKPKTVYVSATKLMARGRMKSKTTARLARQLLEKYGYLVPTGETKAGCIRYRVENPNYERVQASIAECEEHWKLVEAGRRKEERLRKRPNVGTNIDPTETARGDNNWSNVGTNIDPKYHRGNLGESGYEEEEPLKVSPAPLNSYSYLKDGIDPDQPFPIPANDDEGYAVLDRLLTGCEAVDAVRDYFHRKLMHGELTLAMLVEYRRVAA